MSDVARCEAEFSAAPEVVFDAWLLPAVARRWLFAAEGERVLELALDARPGGRFRVQVRGGDGALHEFHGGYRIVDRPHLLEFSLRAPWDAGDDAEGVVRVEIALVEERSRLSLSHEGVEPERAARAWQAMFANLRPLLEVGG